MERFIQTFETSFIKHINTNAWKWHTDFLKLYEQNGRVVYSTLHQIFNRDTAEEPNENLLDKLRYELGWKDETFYNLGFKTQYWRIIELLHTLNIFNSCHGLENFYICPDQRFGLRHTQIDSTALIHLIRGAEAGPKKMNGNDFFDNGLLSKLWNDYLHVNRKEKKKNGEWKYRNLGTANTEFTNTIITDGVALSFQMKRKEKEEKQTSTEKSDWQRAVQAAINVDVQMKLAANEYETIAGFDPGNKLLIAGPILHFGGNTEIFFCGLKA